MTVHTCATSIEFGGQLLYLSWIGFFFFFFFFSFYIRLQSVHFLHCVVVLFPSVFWLEALILLFYFFFPIFGITCIFIT